METLKHLEITSDFHQAWLTAVRAVEAACRVVVEERDIEFWWLRAHLNQPLIEHLAFGLGNQIFFCRVLPAEDTGVPISSNGAVEEYAKKCGALSCALPVERDQEGGWRIVSPDPKVPMFTGEDFEPLLLEQALTQDLIEMSDWEISDWAVNVVVDHVMKEFEIERRSELNYQSTADCDPQIWFVTKEGFRHYVVVRAARYPELRAPMPENISELAEIDEGKGFFASVSFVNADGLKDDPEIGYRPPPDFLYRGGSVHVVFNGLEKI
jgi:hypothetical protein